MDDYSGDSVQFVACPACKKLSAADTGRCEFCDADLDAPAKPPVTNNLKQPKTTAKQSSRFQVQKCPRCGEINRAGVVYCENCGTHLQTGEDANLPTRDLDRESEQDSTLSYEEAEIASEKILGERFKASIRGTTMFQDDMVLRVELESRPNPLLLRLKPDQQLMIGRRSTSDDSDIPEIDLTDYGGFNYGVSRHHGVIRLEGNRLIYTDLASSNGTFINGLRITPHEDYTLRDGDVFRLARMKMQIYFEKRRR